MSEKKRLRIILAITDPFCTAFLKGQAKYMRERGFDVFLFSPAGADVDEYVKNEKCTHIEIPYSRDISVIRDLKCLLLTYKKIRKIQPDVINAGTPKAGLLCMLAAKFAGVKNRVFTLRGLRSTAMDQGFKRSLVEYMEKLSGKYAVKIISISPSMTEYAIVNKLVDGKKTVVLGKASSNGVDPVRFNPKRKHDPQTLLYEKQFGIEGHDIVLGYVGRVVKSKGIEELYRSFQLLSEKYSNLKFLVVGPEESHTDSPSPRILEDMKNDERVVMTGKISDVEHLYPLMDIFSLPSHNFREGFGNVAIEASASGVPIIVTDGAGCQDAVDEGKSGFIVKPMDVESLKNAVEKYILDEQLRKSHGSYGAEFVAKYYANQVIWNAQYELYKSLIDK